METQLFDETRPNIRVEIRNNEVQPEEPMETEDFEIHTASSDEEGEIIENNRHISLKNFSEDDKKAANNFTTGIDIFDKEEQKKRENRAKRFHLSEGEIRSFTDTELNDLRDSLGIDVNTEKEYRFEAVHMRGTDEMSSDDIMKYFMQYAPSSIEWVNDESCNVVWPDAMSSARALFYLSDPIEGMPVEGPCDPFLKETSKDIKDENVQMDNSEDSIVHVSKLLSLGPIPPGYWRQGKSHGKSKLVLLRFATKTDKKTHGAEKFSQYYKKYGNPNYGGLKGFISQSKRARLRGIHEEDAVDSKNPWGSLAENWYQDAEKSEEEVVSIANPLPAANLQSSKMHHRLGFKHMREDSEEPEPAATKSKVPRMRMYADEEEEKIKLKKQKRSPQKPVGNDLRNFIGRRRTNGHQYVEKKLIVVCAEPETFPSKQQYVQRQSREIYHPRNEPYAEKSRDSLSEDSNDEEENGNKTGSKVTVVIKKQRKPTVASTVWSRINTNAKESRYDCSDDDHDESPEKEDESEKRPGFRNNYKSKFSDGHQYKSPLRIEISNDHYQRD